MIADFELAVEKYFAEIEDYGGISSEAEREICEQIQSGDRDAVAELVQANLRFVVKAALQYRGMGLPLSDLIGEGNLGMMIAARRFDVSRGYRFISYAVWWVRHAILKALAEQSRTIRLPNKHVVGRSRMLKAAHNLEQDLGRSPRSSELAAVLDIKPEAVGQLASLGEEVLSLDCAWNEEVEGRLPGEMIPDFSLPPADEPCHRREMQEALSRSLAELSTFEAEVITLYFGLGDQDPMSLQKIGDRFGRSRERIRQIKVRALSRLQRSCRGRGLRTYIEAD